MESDLIALSPKEAVAQGAESLTMYGKLFFPRTFRQKSPAMHEAMGRALYGPERYNAFKVFRDGAKTSLLRVYASQRIAYALSRTIMYVSGSQQHSMFSLRWLRRQVEFNTRWSQTFGLTKGQKWTDEWLEIKCNLQEDESGMPVTLTMLAMGITGQIRGFNPDDFRPDLIILDDVLSEENTATVEQRKKIDDLIFGALLNSLAPSSEAPLAKAVFAQTPFVKDDAIEKCMKDPSWNPLSFSVFDKKVTSNWPERYPTEMLLKEKENHIRRGQYRLWMREKEVTIVAGEEQAIDTTKWKFFDLLPESLDVVISLDPASSESKKADEFAIVALGLKGSDVYVLDYSSAQAVMPDKAANDTFNLILLYGPRKLVVESNSYQRIMAWYLEQEMTKRRIYVAIDKLVVRTKNADRIMQTIPGLAAFGHFYVRPGMSKLIEQADDYDPETLNAKDDLLTAIANGIISLNPAMKSRMVADPETGTLVLDESEYKPLRIRHAP